MNNTDIKRLTQLMKVSKQLPAWRFILLVGIGWLFGLATLVAAIPWEHIFK